MENMPQVYPERDPRFKALVPFFVFVVFSSILMAGNTSCMHFGYPKESSLSLSLSF